MNNIAAEIAQIKFPVYAQKLDSLHEYYLYAALKHQLSWLESCDRTLICSLPGTLAAEPGLIVFDDNTTSLDIRSPVERVNELYELAGKDIRIGRHKISLGCPVITPLKPTNKLRARIVSIRRGDRKKITPDRFIQTVNDRLSKMGIEKKAYIPKRGDRYATQVLRIKKSHQKPVTIPGYSVEVEGLSDVESRILQGLGIGGHKKMGCGFFKKVTYGTYKDFIG